MIGRLAVLGILEDDADELVTRLVTREPPTKLIGADAALWHEHELGHASVAGDPSSKPLLLLLAVLSIVRAFKAGGTASPVGGLDTSEAYEIRVNGTPTAVTANTPYDGWVRFSPAPTTGATLAGDFYYLQRVRFAKEELGLDAILHDFWEAKSIDLVSVR